MTENDYYAIATAAVFGPMLLAAVLVGAHSNGWRGALETPALMFGGLAALVAVGAFLHHVLYG